MDIETFITLIIFAGTGAGAYLLSVALKGVKFVPTTSLNGFSDNQSSEYGTSTSDLLTNPAYSGISSNIYHQD